MSKSIVQIKESVSFKVNDSIEIFLFYLRASTSAGIHSNFACIVKINSAFASVS